MLTSDKVLNHLPGRTAAPNHGAKQQQSYWHGQTMDRLALAVKDVSSAHGGIQARKWAVEGYHALTDDLTAYEVRDVADLYVPCIPLGYTFGRIGNFINGELYGRVTDVPWGMVFPDPRAGNLPRHPSQLYEAILEGPVMLLILWTLGRARRPKGVIFWSFIALYGLFRFFVEFFREPDIQLGFVLGDFSMGQVLSFPMAVGGLLMIWWSYRRERKMPKGR